MSKRVEVGFRISYDHALLKAVFKFGYEYQKVGLILTGLVPDSHLHQHLFVDDLAGQMSRLSGVMDALNKRYDHDRVQLAGAGYDPSWHYKCQWMSPRRTTDCKDILQVR